MLVTTLLVLFGRQLESLPLVVRALVESGILVVFMANVVMPVLSIAAARWLATAPQGHLSRTGVRDVNHRSMGTPGEHPQLDLLPDWPTETIAVLGTAGQETLHAIPVSAPLRMENHRILLSLHRSRGSLARLREHPRVALTILSQGNIAATAQGRACIVQEWMPRAPDYAAVVIDVERIDDHRQAAFIVESGIARQWVDEDEQRALRERVEALRELSSSEISDTASEQKANFLPVRNVPREQRRD